MKPSLSSGVVVAALLSVALAACRSDAPAAKTPARPARWAQPIAKPGVENLHKVSDALYRGAQPTAEGFRQLHQMGIRTVVNLRTTSSDREAIGDLPLEYIPIPVQAYNADPEEIVRFLRVVTDPDKQPVFLHCLHGADRTGMMSAAYRVVVQGWSKQEAIDEMKDGGFGHHAVFVNLVGHVDKLDVEALKRQLASAPVPASAPAPEAATASTQHVD